MTLTPRSQERKQKNPLEDIKNLSRFVYRLNRSDKTSEDYVYYQIISYLAEHGSFTVTELDKKIIIYKKINGKQKKIKIERRKLKKILEGTDKKFTGLISLNYVIDIPELKNRGGKQEKTYYLTEKGVMASIGFYSYKENINLKKILSTYKPLGVKYKKFIYDFIQLQIQVYLAYFYVSGVSLAFKKENNAEHEKFRHKLIHEFELKINNSELEEQFREILKKFNLYRKIHLTLFKEKSFFGFLWEEHMLVQNNVSTEYGFHGWYRLQFLTGLDEKLKLKKYRKQKQSDKINKKQDKGIEITLVSEPEFLYSNFQTVEEEVSDERVKNTMKFMKLS